VSGEKKCLKFQGHSDDVFACTGPGIDVDLDNCGSGQPIYMRVGLGAETLIISGQYCPGPAAGWQIGVAPGDGEDGSENRMLDCFISIGHSERDYSPLLMLFYEGDITVEVVDGKGRTVPRTPAEQTSELALARAQTDKYRNKERRLARHLAEINRQVSMALQEDDTP
jgi:hypothetical protein